MADTKAEIRARSSTHTLADCHAWHISLSSATTTLLDTGMETVARSRFVRLFEGALVGMPSARAAENAALSRSKECPALLPFGSESSLGSDKRAAAAAAGQTPGAVPACLGLA